MKIAKIRLENFKRFEDLTIDMSLLASVPKFVLLIGSNGSGKSSIFDAFEWAASDSKGRDFNIDNQYFNKNKEKEFSIDIQFEKQKKLLFINNKRIINEVVTPFDTISLNHLFYGRSSLRQVTELSRNRLGIKIDYNQDSDRPRRYIDRDARLENDIEKITQSFLSEAFLKTGITIDELRNKYTARINQSFKNIFEDDADTSLSLVTLIPSLEGQTPDIKFQKGNSIIHYDLLSSGEKEVFNILLNLFSRTEIYQDTIYFIDELDVHLNTSLQYGLIKEIVEQWIPEGCQLWTASHSLGFIQYAQETANAAIVDLDLLNFDIPQYLYPATKQDLEVFEIAVPKEIIFKIFQNKKIIICENKNDEYYNLLGIEDTLFIGRQNNREVFLMVKNDSNFYGIRDRDFLTQQEVNNLHNKFPNLYILQYYCFENYLYHPDNIAELNPPDFDKHTYIEEITT